MGIIYAGMLILLGAIVLMIGYCLGCDDKTKQFRDEGLYIPPQRKK